MAVRDAAQLAQLARQKKANTRGTSEAWLAMVTADEQWQALLAEDREALIRAQEPS